MAYTGSDNQIAVNKRRRTRDKFLVDLKVKTGCAKCGYSKVAGAMDYHHIDPKTKSGQVGQLIYGSMDKFMEEVDKCILLCATCHREFHHYEKKYGIDIEQFLEGGINNE